MPSLDQIIAEARRSGDFAPVIAAIPYAAFFRLAVDLRPEETIVTLPFQEQNIGNPVLPALHGGALGAFLEMTGIITLLRAVDTPGLPKTINLTIEYLRAGHARDTFAVGRPTRLGRRVAALRVEAWQTERSRPITAATIHFLMPQATPAGGEPA